MKKEIEKVEVGAAGGSGNGAGEPVKPYKKKLKKIEIAPMQFNKDAMQRQANKITQRICANGKVELVEAGEEPVKEGLGTKMKTYYEIKIDKEACNNQRRHASKYCHACSAAHKKSLETPNVETKNE